MIGRALPEAPCSGGGRPCCGLVISSAPVLRCTMAPSFPPSGGARPMVVAGVGVTLPGLGLARSSSRDDTVVRAPRWREGAGGRAGKHQTQPGPRDLQADPHQWPSTLFQERPAHHGDGRDGRCRGDGWPPAGAAATATAPGSRTALGGRSVDLLAGAVGETVAAASRSVLVQLESAAVAGRVAGGPMQDRKATSGFDRETARWHCCRAALDGTTQEDSHGAPYSRRHRQRC